MITPIGLGLGRLGNFIGQELWGRPSDVPWAMVFPNDVDGLARHPSQLYQFALEGLIAVCHRLLVCAKAASSVGSLGCISARVFKLPFLRWNSSASLTRILISSGLAG